MRGMGLRRVVMGLSCFWNSGYQYLGETCFGNENFIKSSEILGILVATIIKKEGRR